MNVKINSQERAKRINDLMRHDCPRPSEETTLDDKLDALSTLIGLNDALFSVMGDILDSYTFSPDQDFNHAKQCVHFKLLTIAQLLNDHLTSEFNHFTDFLVAQNEEQRKAQGGKDAQ